MEAKIKEPREAGGTHVVTSLFQVISMHLMSIGKPTYEMRNENENT